MLFRGNEVATSWVVKYPDPSRIINISRGANRCHVELPWYNETFDLQP